MQKDAVSDDPRRSRAPRRAVIAFLLIAVTGWAMLAWISRVDVPGKVVWLLLVLAAEWTIMLMLLGRPSWRRHISWRHVWIAALAFRVCGFMAMPVFEDDHFRFLWDGYVFSRTGNPYAAPPAAWFGDPNVPANLQSILDQVNYSDVPTIYGPLTECAFLLGHSIAPGALWPWKLELLAADCVLLLILKKLAGNEFALRVVAFAAWCPLAVFETSFNVHPDALAVTLLAGALAARKEGRDGWLGACCGAAVAARILAVVLLPFLLWRRKRRAWLVIAATMLAFYVPFWLQGNTADLAGLQTFARDWEFNSCVFALVDWLTTPENARFLTTAAYGLIWLALFVRWSRHRVADSTPPPGLPVFAALFLLSPTFNPWYALWLLPFVALQPSITGVAMLAAVSLSYLTWQNLGDTGLGGFNHPAWVRPVEFGLIGLAGVFEAARRGRWRSLKLAETTT